MESAAQGTPEILSETSEAIFEINQLMSAVDDDSVNNVPYEGSWTAPQLLRHVTKSIDAMAKAMEQRSQPATRNPGERIPQLKGIFLDFSKKLTQPDFIIPEDKVYEKQSAIDELIASFNRFKESAAHVNESDLMVDLPIGPITKLEIIHFVLYHTQRHLYQMKKICGALKHK